MSPTFGERWRAQREKEREATRRPQREKTRVAPRAQVEPRVGDGRFADALREARSRAGLSQSRLAEKAGFDHSYISRMESSRRRPALEAVVALAAALGSDDEERDALLWAAGFVPAGMAQIDTDMTRVVRLLSECPELRALFEALDGPLRPEMREIVRWVVALAGRARGVAA